MHMISEVATKEQMTGDLDDHSASFKKIAYTRIVNSFTMKTMIPYNKNDLFEQKDNLVKKN